MSRLWEGTRVLVFCSNAVKKIFRMTVPEVPKEDALADSTEAVRRQVVSQLQRLDWIRWMTNDVDRFSLPLERPGELLLPCV